MYFHYCQKIEHTILILRASRSAPENYCEPSYERLKVQKHVKQIQKYQKNTKHVTQLQKMSNSQQMSKNLKI